MFERDVPAFGQADQDDASVAGLACPPHQSLPFELLDQDRDRWLRQALELSELGDPPRAAAEGFQETDFGSRKLAAELSDEQPGEQRRSREQLARDVINLLRAGGNRPRFHIEELYYPSMLVNCHRSEEGVRRPVRRGRDGGVVAECGALRAQAVQDDAQA